MLGTLTKRIFGSANDRRVKGYQQLPELARALERAVGYEPVATDIPRRRI